MFIVNNNIESQSSEILLNQVSKVKMELYHYKYCMSYFRTVSIFDIVIFLFLFQWYDSRVYRSLFAFKLRQLYSY